MAVQSGLCRTWSETPKTGFLTSSLTCTLKIRNILSSLRINPVFGVSYQVRHNLACFSIMISSIYSLDCWIYKPDLFHTITEANTRRPDQTAWMRRLIFTDVVCIQRNRFSYYVAQISRFQCRISKLQSQTDAPYAPVL